MGKDPRIKVKQSIKHTGREKKQTCTFQQSRRDTYAGHSLWSTNCCEPLQVQMSHCSVFELACVPNSLQELDMLKLNGGGKCNSLVLAYSTFFAQKIIHCPYLFVFILYYFHHHLHPQPPCSVTLFLCLYLYRWNSIGEVIEKLSCRSGWFVGPVHALIHPAALPHK